MSIKRSPGFGSFEELTMLEEGRSPSFNSLEELEDMHRRSAIENTTPPPPDGSVVERAELQRSKILSPTPEKINFKGLRNVFISLE